MKPDVQSCLNCVALPKDGAFCSQRCHDDYCTTGARLIGKRAQLSTDAVAAALQGILWELMRIRENIDKGLVVKK